MAAGCCAQVGQETALPAEGAQGYSQLCSVGSPTCSHFSPQKEKKEHQVPCHVLSNNLLCAGPKANPHLSHHMGRRLDQPCPSHKHQINTRPLHFGPSKDLCCPPGAQWRCQKCPASSSLAFPRVSMLSLPGRTPVGRRGC